jgi:hypothetical protein
VRVYLGGPNTFVAYDTSVSTAANGIAVDSAGEAYVVGTTNTPNFPVTSGAYQSACGTVCAPAFFSKLDPSGSNLDTVVFHLFGREPDRYPGRCRYRSARKSADRWLYQLKRFPYHYRSIRVLLYSLRRN